MKEQCKYIIKNKTSFFVTLELCYQYCRGDNEKYRLLSKHLFQRKHKHGGWKRFKIRISFPENNVLQLSNRNKNVD